MLKDEQNINIEKHDNNLEPFVDKPFTEEEGGRFDRYGFYRMPDGSYWDSDEVYFNKFGVDKHGGIYDKNLEYNPGKGWIPELLCYEDEKGSILAQKPILEEDEDDYNELDDLYDNIKNVNMDDEFDDNNHYQRNNYNRPNHHQNQQQHHHHNNQHPQYQQHNAPNNRNFNLNEQNTDGHQQNLPQQNSNPMKTREVDKEFKEEFQNLNIKTKDKNKVEYNLFNKIPDNLAVQNNKQENRVEKKIEVDSLFD